MLHPGDHCFVLQPLLLFFDHFLSIELFCFLLLFLYHPLLPLLGLLLLHFDQVLGLVIFQEFLLLLHLIEFTQILLFLLDLIYCFFNFVHVSVLVLQNAVVPFLLVRLVHCLLHHFLFLLNPLSFHFGLHVLLIPFPLIDHITGFFLSLINFLPSL